MIIYLSGDIFKSPVQVLTNPINCVGVMGAGLAKAFAKQWPKMDFDYRQRCKNGDVKVGQPYLWEGESSQVLNFPTKDHYKNPSKISYIQDGLNYLAKNYADMGISSIAIPALGCGLGGLKWTEVKTLIDETLGPISDLNVVVYMPKDADFSSRPDDNQESSQFDNSGNGFAASEMPN